MSSPRPPSPSNELNAEAGPSRPRIPSPDAHAESPFSEQYLQEFGFVSHLPRSAIPRTPIKHTNLLLPDIFAAKALADVHDPELLQDLPLLFPPPQPSPSGPRPLWGLSSDARLFLPSSSDEPPVPIDPSTQAQVRKFHTLKHQNIHFNAALHRTRAFKNPHVYSDLVSHLGIDETRSNLPILDTGRSEGGWRSVFPFTEDELIEGDPYAATQRQQTEEKERLLAILNAKGKRGIEFVKGSAKTSEPARKQTWSEDRAEMAKSSSSKCQDRSLGSHASSKASTSSRAKSGASSRSKRR